MFVQLREPPERVSVPETALPPESHPTATKIRAPEATLLSSVRTRSGDTPPPSPASFPTFATSSEWDTSFFPFEHEGQVLGCPGWTDDHDAVRGSVLDLEGSVLPCPDPARAHGGPKDDVSEGRADRRVARVGVEACDLGRIGRIASADFGEGGSL